MTEPSNMSESAENASVAAQENAEMLDVVDDSNRVIDCLARGQVHDDGLKHRSVHLAIFNPAGELFIHKRSAEKSRLAGYWDISAAGHVEPGESYPDAARRELGEELGVEVPLSAATVFEASEATGNEFAALFIGMCGQEVQPSPREIELGEWVSLHKLAERLANPGDEKYTSNLVNIAMFLAQNQHLLPEDVQKESGLGSREEIQFKKFFGQAEENHTSEPTDDVSTESGNTDNEATDSVVADNTASSAKQIISLLKVQQIVAWPGLPTHPVSHRRLLKGAFDGPMPRLEAALSKYLFLGILASLALAILAYPWGFEQATLDGILDKYGLNSEYQGTLVGWFALTQIYPLVASGVEPLILKETMVAWVILAAVPLFALLILLRPGRRLLRLPFFLLFAAFLSYGAYSVLYILPSESLKMGLYTWTRILTWTLLIAITASVVRTRRQVTCILIFLGLVLTLMTFGSITQHLQWDTVLPRYVGSVRNRMSSTIGHNNGVASLLIYAWFPSLAMIFLARKIQLRAAAIVLTGIILFVLLALQTRGVWIVLLALTPPFLFICQRTSPLPIKARHVLLVVGFLLLAVLVQSIDSPLNPFKGPISLVERFQDFSPTKLKTTTQRRILKASLAYMPDETERWMFGVGLGGFIYVYPEIQAQYFAKLQGETDVLYRPKRTVQAHSDLLQLYIETGMVGILLLLIALWLLARRMEGTFRATPDIPGKLQQLAIYFPMLGTMLHGVGDFPFHIASTTTTAAIFLGITLAGRRIWAPASATLPEPTRIQRSLSGAAEGKLAGIRFGILLFCLVLYLPAMTMMVVNGAYMASRSLAHMSSVLLDRYRSDPDLQGTMLGRGALLQVRHDLRGAFRMFPPDPDTHRIKAELYTMIAQEGYAAWQREREAGSPSERLEPIRLNAIADAETALNEIRRAEENGARYHSTTYVAAAIKILLMELDPDNRRKHLEDRLNYLRETVRLNPSFARAILELIDIYMRYFPKRQEQMAFYRAQLKKFNPAEYKSAFIDQYFQSIYAKRYSDALRWLRMLQEDDPENPDHFYRESGVVAQAGNVYQARRVLRKSAERFPDFVNRKEYELVPEMIEGNWQAVYDQTTDILRGNPDDLISEPLVRALQMFAARELGMQEEFERLNAEMEERIAEADDEKAATYLENLAEALHLYYKRPEEAVEYIKRRTVLPGRPHPVFYVMAARIDLENGNLRAVEHYLTEALAIAPTDIQARTLHAELSDTHPEMAQRILEESQRKFEEAQIQAKRDALKARFPGQN